jgi:type III secretion protein Q
MALPFDLPVLSRGFAELTPAACAAGNEAAAGAASALSALLGCEVVVRGRACPGPPAARAAVARLALDLTALPGAAVLEVETTLVAALVDRLAGGTGAAPGATALTPVEALALELFALAALDGACAAEAVETALRPRLARGVVVAAGALAIELDVTAAATAGRARLLVPAAALRALAGAPGAAAVECPAGTLRLVAALRGGEVPLTRPELEALAEGDVVALDGGADEPRMLVLPGGVRLRGRVFEGSFHVEEIMTDRSAQLPLRLEVELARVEVTLADLTRLEPGAALALGIDRRGLVTLRCGERAIARGELVEIDGAVGVRILALEGTP